MKAVKKDPPRKPIYVSNPNDPRLKAYRDSLSLYNRGEEKLKYGRNNPNATNLELNRKEEEIDRRFAISKSRGSFGNNLIKAIDMQKIGSGDALRNVPLYKKPVQPVIFEQKATKTNVSPKELSMPKPSIKINRTVELPDAITGIKYDIQKGDVIVGISGKDVTMPRKEFDSWVNKPENRKMFDDYRKSKAKK
jgi:hypothetical protein